MNNYNERIYIAYTLWCKGVTINAEPNFQRTSTILNV